MRLFSYVVEHDNGFAPNPYHGVCTLAQCKYRKDKTKRRNLVEMAEVGAWIVGTGGADRSKSAGHGKLIYAMRVDGRLTLGDYDEDKRFECKKKKANGTYEQKMGDNFYDYDNDWEKKNRFVLIGHQFYYFGRNAIEIPPEFHNIEKSGPSYRRDFSEEFIEKFVSWIKYKFKTGVHGDPCGRDSGIGEVEAAITKHGRNKRPSCKSSC